MDLNNPQIIGFGISDRTSFEQATEYAKEAIIGSAFIKHLNREGVIGIEKFIKTVSG